MKPSRIIAILSMAIVRAVRILFRGRFFLAFDALWIIGVVCFLP